MSYVNNRPKPRCQLPDQLAFAEITPRCPQCGETDGPRYTVAQTPYGIQTGCTACGYSSYYSIGD